MPQCQDAFLATRFFVNFVCTVSGVYKGGISVRAPLSCLESLGKLGLMLNVAFLLLLTIAFHVL